MADVRTLKLNLLADVDQFTKGLNKADNEVSGFGDKLGKFGKVAGAAFAAAGAAAAAYAGKLLIDGVKAAVEDAAAQEKLRATLQNVTNATDAQIAATEDYITKTTLATGVTDDQLRPSLDRLVRATGNVTEAQKLQALALDVSVGTGKSLEAVTEALSKAQEGNLTGLQRLGAGLSKADLATGDLEAITAKLAKTFEGQASRQADTFQGKLQRLQVAFDEGKETVGTFILDAITPLVTKFVNDVIPAIQRFADEFGPKLEPIIKGIGNFITTIVVPAFRALWTFLTEFLVPLLRNIFSPVIEGLRKAWESIITAIGGNNGVTSTFQKLRAVIEPIATFIRDKVAPVVGTVLGKAFETLGKIIAAVIPIVSNVVTTIVNGITRAIQVAEDLINGLIRGWNRVPDWLRPGGKVNEVNFVGPKMVTISPDSLTGAKTSKGKPEAEDPWAGLFSGLSTGGNAGTAAGAAASAAKSAEKATKAAADKAERDKRLSAKDVDFINAVNQWVADFDKPRVEVNVTGTMLDPEGVARQVAQVLERSAARTGNYVGLGLNPVGLPAAVV